MPIMSRKNEFSRSHAHGQDSEDRRRPRGERSRDDAAAVKPPNALSPEDINEQIRSFFAKDLDLL